MFGRRYGAGHVPDAPLDPPDGPEWPDPPDTPCEECGGNEWAPGEVTNDDSVRFRCQCEVVCPCCAGTGVIEGADRPKEEIVLATVAGNEPCDECAGTKKISCSGVIVKDRCPEPPDPPEHDVD